MPRNNKDDEIVSAGELADWLGLSVTALSTHVRNNVVSKESGGRFLLKKSIKAYVAHIRAAATGRGSPTAEAKSRLVAAQANLAESKAAAMRGELIPAVDVEKEWSGVLRTVRAGMLAVPSRAAQRLPHLTAHDVSEIDREVRDALGELGQDQLS